MKRGLPIVLLLAAVVSLAAAERPDYAEMRKAVRKDHPRLFLNRENIEVFKQRANTVCKADLEKLRTRVDALPDKPQIELTQDARWDGDKIVCLRNKGDQNQVTAFIKNSGGADAVRCAILFYATGDRKYVVKGYAYMQLANEFAALSMRSRILPEWYHSGRLCALVAYDWLYNELTPDQRKAFLVPMLKHLEFMRNPGFMCNRGAGYNEGNYGERGLWWHAGLAAVGDGIADDLAERFLKDGWELDTRMMDFREKVSGGKGVLTSITAGYSFGHYPWATNNFLNTLKSACNIDGTKLWTQPREYANYFNWMVIPVPNYNEDLTNHGWGDTVHIHTSLPIWMMYTHLAYSIHFYGDSEQARALMTILPEKVSVIQDWQYPWTRFILTGFDPDKKFTGDLNKVLSGKLAEDFPSYGLLNMRSGFGPNDTYASIKCGAQEKGHQHYDELAFIIYKQGFQALDTGARGQFVHHKAYYQQTVAHNSLLIRMEQEPLPGTWYPRNAPKVDWSKIFCDGGQNRMTAGRSLGVDQSPYHAVTAGDATACYSGKKCKEAVRQFVYIKPDYFVIYDRLTSVKPEQQKVFLLHTQRRPEMQDGYFRSNAGSGSLFIRTLLPEKAKTELIGGPGKEFWTNGQNYSLETDPGIMAQIRKKGGIENTWLGTYRLEVSPAENADSARFLTVLQAADGKVSAMVPVEKITDGDFDGVRFTTREGITATLKFRRSGLIAGEIRLEKDGKILLDRELLKPSPAGPAQFIPPVNPVKVSNAPGDVARLDLYCPDGKVALAEKGTAFSTDSPRWFVQGNGLLTQFHAARELQEGSITVRIIKGNEFRVKFMGPDVRKNGKFMPYWIEYTMLTANGRPLLEKPVTVWHNTPVVRNIPVKAGDEVRIQFRYRTAEALKQ